MLEWRKFNFFDLKPFGEDEIVSNVVADADVISSTCGNNQIILGDSNGFVHVFPKNFREYYSFKTHNSVSFCELSIQNNLLITLGIDDSIELTPEFKVWNLNKLNKSIPACLRTVKTNIQKPTALGVSENGQYMAIGFERGNISIYKGDISREKTKNVKNIILGTTSIRGISFKQMGKVVQMFICSDSGVFLYTIQGRDKEFKSTLDTPSMNISTTCSWLQTGHNEGYFMVGRDDAIYCYTVDGRAPCYAFEGRKVLIRWFRSHLLMVTAPLRDNSLQSKPHTLTVIDVVNRFIVFTTSVEAVCSVFVEFGTCYVLTKDKILFHLDEKDLQSKLNSLYKKNMYDTAVKIARNNKYDKEGLSGIFKQYGDHLYAKGHFSGAVDQYIKTIGFLEPSYVIRRFLDSRHTQYLTDYLESVHKEGKASTDHTTLLLNCFTRLDRTQELKAFLKNYKQNNFNIDVAIRVCRKSCIDEALELAKFNNKHEYAVEILIEDMKLFSESIDYISRLTYDDAEMSLMKYGNILMEKCPTKMFELLKKLCTDYIVKKCDEPERDPDDDLFAYRNGGFMDREPATPEDFIHLFDDSKQTIEYIEYLIQNLPTCSKALYNSLIEHYLRLWKANEDDKVKLEQRLVDLIKNQSQFYDDNQVLMLCHTFEFWPGTILIYEEKKLFNLIVRHFLDTKDYPSLYALCKRLGSSDSSIWLHTLNGLKNNKQVPTSFLQELLQVIANEKLQSPIQVLNALSAIENGPNLSSVRHYFTQIFQKEADLMSYDESLGEKYRRETEELKTNIHMLNNEPVEFRGSLCDACHEPLVLPALFFMCKHSFHRECIRSYSETEKDCMVCRKKNIQLYDSIHKQFESRRQQNSFNEQLSSSHEPFSIIAEYFGKNLFNKTNFEADEDEEMQESIKINTNIPKKLQKPQINPMMMTEGKVRVEETLSTNVEHKPQLSEGRLRLQEHSYRVKPQITSSSQPQTKKIEINSTKTSVNYPVSANPFGGESDDEEDDGDGKNPFGRQESNYDDSKNPFADDETDDGQDVVRMLGRESNKPQTSLNPFGDDEAD
ncbi:CLUMA_CG019552, isoform A [Clunio marinus]|uniref:Vacuolar protein sorting-associated protein 11 homolog n=1 Tax=Clunio marinus TaxID=568069 RepID=A0A1J1J3A7_9DIPT|nr:CLUMA_CG019552, isoform A [Clunio marinus]